MPQRYSTYEAKSKFSEVIRKVRAGQRIVITYHGEEVAEVRPVARASKRRETLEERIRKLERRGEVHAATAPASGIQPFAKRPGALKRFLESRD